jgi:putative transposase
MSRGPRYVEPGGVYHVYDRGNARRTLFAAAEDFDHFVNVLRNNRSRSGVELLAFCLMPNHWHVVVRPCTARDLARSVARWKQVHTERVHRAEGTEGEGHLYQSRFRSRLLETPEAIFDCCRYVERNALSAGLVARAEEWRWGSLWHRVRSDPQKLLDPMPVELPEEWVGIVNAE